MEESNQVSPVFSRVSEYTPCLSYSRTNGINSDGKDKDTQEKQVYIHYANVIGNEVFRKKEEYGVSNHDGSWSPP